jgi:PAS domain-containing protein
VKKKSARSASAQKNIIKKMIHENDLKRKKHNELEVRRRKRINQKFNELQMICQSKCDRRSILQSAIDLIQAQKVKLGNLEEKVNHLRELQEQEDDFGSSLLLQPKPDEKEIIKDELLKEPSSSFDFYSIYNSTSSPLAVLSLEGSIVDCNEAFCNLIGRSRDQILAQETIFSVFTTPDIASFAKEVQTLIEGTQDLIAIQGKILKTDPISPSCFISLTGLISRIRYSTSSNNIADYLSWIGIQQAESS